MHVAGEVQGDPGLRQQVQHLLVAEHQIVVLRKLRMRHQVLMGRRHHPDARLLRLMEGFCQPVRVRFHKNAEGLGAVRDVRHQRPELIAHRGDIGTARPAGQHEILVDFLEFFLIYAFRRVIAPAAEACRAGVHIVVAGNHPDRDAGGLHLGKPGRQVKMALLLPVEAQVAGHQQGIRLFLLDLPVQGVQQLVPVLGQLPVAALQDFHEDFTVLIQRPRQIMNVRHRHHLRFRRSPHRKSQSHQNRPQNGQAFH